VQSTRHDPNLAALHASTGLPGHVVDVVVLTADDGLLATLREASGPEHAIWHAPTADTAVDLLVGGRCGILIADLATLRGDAARLLERLHAQFPELVLIAAGRREEEQAVLPLVTSGRVYRFLHRPVSPARAGLFLTAATRRYSELLKVETIAFTAVKTMATRPNWIRLAIAASVLVVIAIGFFAWRTREVEVTTTTNTTIAVQRGPTVDEQIANALASGQMAYATGRLVEPRGDNALEYFRAALKMKPDNADARAGVVNVISILEQRVATAIQQRKAPEAAAWIGTLRRADPQNARLDGLQQQVIALARGASSRPVEVPTTAVQRPETQAPTPQQTQSAPAPAVAQASTSAPTPAASSSVTVATTPPPATTLRSPNLTAMRARVSSDRLLEPADDSALTYLREARDANEDTSAVKIAATDLGTRILDRASSAIASGEQDEARRWLDATTALDREFELGLPDIDSVTRQLEGLRAAQERAAIGDELAAAVRLRERGQLLEPPQQNAYDIVMSLRTRNPKSEDVRSEQQKLAFELLERTRTALASGNLDQADLFTQRADTLVPGMTATKTLQQQIIAARDDAASNTLIAATTLQRVREVPARYPQEAQRSGTEGWVDVDFTIGTDGVPQDVVARDAQPRRIFDRAAVDSVSQWRFEPIVRSGKAVTQRATLRVRFQLQ
jgi:TonB family protein